MTTTETMLAAMSTPELLRLRELLSSDDQPLTPEVLNAILAGMGLDDQRKAESPSDLQRTAAAEASLHEFIRQAWSIVEPDSDFRDGEHLRGICWHLEAIASGKLTNLLMNIPPGCMKLIEDNCPVLTPSGWRTHGDLMPGDYVFHPSGKPTRIRSITSKARANIRITFSNGESLRCNEGHLWTVYDRRVQNWKTRTTGELMETAMWSGGRCVYQLPNVEAPLQFKRTSDGLPIAPYWLGAWLGDGSADRPAITHAYGDRRVIEACEERTEYRATICHTHPTQTSQRTEFRHQGLQALLRENDLYRNKHVPTAYQMAPTDDRLQLLAGWLDTDGTRTNTGKLIITTVCPRLRDDLTQLLTGLAQRPSVTKHKTLGYGKYRGGRTNWRIAWQPTIEVPCALEEKRPNRLIRQRRIGIASIEPAAETAWGHCINVDAPDGLYVCGRTCIVTHNSLATAVFLHPWVWTHEPGMRFLTGSYDGQLSTRDAVRSRQIIDSTWYQERWGNRFTLSSDQNQKTRYDNDKRGWRMATSVGGRGTGEHPDIIIADDAHNTKKAESATERQHAIRWWDGTMSTRGVARGARRVVVGQRLAQGDLSGHILDRIEGGGDQTWDHICLPMRFEPDRMQPTRLGWTDWRTEDGELLWPDVFPERAVRQLELDLGSLRAAGQLQQRPVPLEGGLFEGEWFQFASEIPAD